MLTVRDHMTLQLEQRPVRDRAAKEAVVLELFHESLTRYVQRVDSLLDREDALAAYPVVVNRLRTRREVLRAKRRRALSQAS